MNIFRRLASKYESRRIEREISAGLVKMRAELGMPQPHRFDPAACVIGLFALVCVCLGVFAGTIR